MKFVITALSLFIITLSTNAQSFTWEWQNSKPQGNNLNDITAITPTHLIAVGDASTVLTSMDGGINWNYQQIDSTGKDYAGVCFVNTTTGYICGEEGVILKTTDGGSSWISQNSGSTFKLYDIKFANADTGFAVGGAGTTGVAVMTTNGGTTWSPVATPSIVLAYGAGLSLTGDLFIGTNASATLPILSRSTDDGATWQNVTPAGFTTSIYSITTADINVIYAAGGSGKVLKSTNGGASFFEVAAAGSGTIQTLYFSDSSNGFAGAQSGIVYATTNGGVSWTPTNVSKEILRGFAKTSGGYILVGNYGTILFSGNNGATWSPVFSSLTTELLREVTFFDELNGLAVGGSTTASDTLGFILKTTDGGKNWVKMDYNFKFQLYSIAAPNSNVWYVGTGDNKIFKTTDAGSTWAQQTQPVTGTTHDFNEIAFATENYGYAIGLTGKIIKTIDGGANWTNVTNPFGTNTIYDMAVLDSLTVIAVGNAANAHKTTNGGTSWSPLSPGIPGIYFGTEFQGNFGVIAAFSSPSVLISVTKNAGTNWTPVNSPSNLTSSVWAIAIKDTNSFWIADISGNIAYTNDGGNTWTPAKSPSGNGIYEFSAVNGHMWGVGSGGTIIKGYLDSKVPVELTSFTVNSKNNRVVLQWKTATETNNRGFEIERKNSGSAWKRIAFIPGKGTTSLVSSYKFEDSEFGSGKVVYRLKQVDYDGTFNYSQEVEFDAVTPAKFELSQNYPNPFNPSTVIKYSVAQKDHVTLKVFNILGSEVVLLVNSVQEAGSYNIRFDASSLSSGVYFYELTSGTNRVSKKMILTK